MQVDRPKREDRPKKNDDEGGFIQRSAKPRQTEEVKKEAGAGGGFNRGPPRKTEGGDDSFARGNFRAKKDEKKPSEGESKGFGGFRSNAGAKAGQAPKGKKGL